MAASECTCVKWHAPKPTRYFLTDAGEKICLVSGQAALDLLERYKVKGRVTQVAGRGFTAYQKALAQRLYESGEGLSLQALEEPEPEAEPEPDGEPVGAAAE